MLQVQLEGSALPEEGPLQPFTQQQTPTPSLQIFPNVPLADTSSIARQGQLSGRSGHLIWPIESPM